MNSRIQMLLDNVLREEHFRFRQPVNRDELLGFTGSMALQGLSGMQRAQKRLEWVLGHEEPVILPGEQIVFTRTVPEIPELFTEKEWENIRAGHYIHEKGRVCNICPDYGYTIKTGLEQRRREAEQSRKACLARNDKDGVEFTDALLGSIYAIENLVARYARYARETGRNDIYSLLQKVPRYGATTFYEALQFFRILHFCLWVSGNYHNTVGRFDQYMFGYLKNDLDSGVLDYNSAFELLEEFFITFNKDSGLYPGMQQGDNGQSLVLGGVDENGVESFNLLSEMCLNASLELKLIDPKINLRVTSNTPVEVYGLGTELTKQGLGFPQYSNDEIVIPGLLSKGYELKDARNYVVAACWEFIIPGTGMDIPNIAALSFAKVVDAGVKKHLAACSNFETFMEKIKDEARQELDAQVSKLRNIYMEPAPVLSMLMDGCIENARDISFGAKYNNYGVHGTGISTAADSLASIKKYVFDTRAVSAGELIYALETNFSGNDSLWIKLKYDSPKMGNDDDFVDNIAVELLNGFAGLTAGLVNERGGCYRPGSGSAMYYLWHANEIGASADGRKKGEPLSANFSPGLNVKLNGPVSIIKSFSKPDMKKIMNGGPLTLELHDTVFRNQDSKRKVSQLVKSYMDLGGHQLQINAVNREQLLKAKEHPENYRNLIVRVWGWSGYFTQLDEPYQDHIIQRAELEI